MADELHLNTDETVVDRIGKVGYGGFLSFNNDLVLTNQNIILVKKGLFGDVQDVVKFPLGSLRVVNGEVQAKKGHPDNMTYTLDLLDILKDSLSDPFMERPVLEVIPDSIHIDF